MTQNEHVYAICCLLEVDGEVISSETVKTIEDYLVLNFKLLALVVSEIFQKLFRDGGGRSGHQR